MAWLVGVALSAHAAGFAIAQRTTTGQLTARITVGTSHDAASRGWPCGPSLCTAPWGGAGRGEPPHR